MTRKKERPHVIAPKGPFRVVLDVWDGDHHTEHVARYAGNFEALLSQVRSELRNGLLVNLRGEAGWGKEDAFDTRITPHAKKKGKANG